MKDEKIIVTLLGADKVGIVAELTAALAKYGVNIEDIKQTIMQDYFVMFLLGDLMQSERNSRWKFGFKRKIFLTKCIQFKIAEGIL